MDHSVAFCPACGLVLSKGDGCNSMTCVCGTSFSWSQQAKKTAVALRFEQQHRSNTAEECARLLCRVRVHHSNPSFELKPRLSVLLQDGISTALSERGSQRTNSWTESLVPAVTAAAAAETATNSRPQQSIASHTRLVRVPTIMVPSPDKRIHESRVGNNSNNTTPPQAPRLSQGLPSPESALARRQTRSVLEKGLAAATHTELISIANGAVAWAELHPLAGMYRCRSRLTLPHTSTSLFRRSVFSRSPYPSCLRPFIFGTLLLVCLLTYLYIQHPTTQQQPKSHSRVLFISSSLHLI